MSKISDTIKIGAIYDLKGEQSALDAPSAKGAELAVMQINNAGGLLGKKVKLLLHDGKTNLKTIHSIAESLASSGDISAVFGFSDTDQTMSAAPVLARAGICFITSGASSPKLPAQVPDWLFLACFGDNVQAAAGAEFAFAHLHKKSACILTQSDMEYTLLLSKYFKERFSEQGGIIIAEDAFVSSVDDYTGIIKKIKLLQPTPDMLYISAGPDKIGGVVRQLRTAKIEMPIMGGDSYDSPLLLKTAVDFADEIYFTTHCLLDEKHGAEIVKKFIAAYRENFSNEIPNAFSALGYDTVNLIANAIKTANSAAPKDVRDSLQKTKNLNGITGEISYHNGEAIPHKSVAIVKISNGKLSKAARLTPQKIPKP